MEFTSTKVKQMQVALRDKGFYHGKIDGDWGPKTDRAVIDFKRSVGLRPRPYVGPITWNALFNDLPVQPRLITGEPPWLRNARGHIGLREIKGRAHNPQILKWWDLMGAGFEDDETPWCAGFVGGILEEEGIRSSRSAMARSYERWGKALSRPAVGCVVTFWRGRSKATSGGKGHVAFVVGVDQRGNLMCLGGNQADAVNVKPFGRGRVTSYRWPANSPHQPHYKLPVVKSNGQLSTNEA